MPKKTNSKIDSTLYGFGSNIFSQLNYNEDLLESPSLIRLKTITDKKVIKIACGEFHTLVLCEDNHLYGWGVSDEYALGSTKSTVPDCPDLIRRIPFSRKISDIIAGSSFSAILTTTGKVYMAGTFKANGRIGFSATKKYAKEFTEVPILRRICKISGNMNHILALDKTGAVWGFGANDCFQLGYRNQEHRKLECLTPKIILRRPVKIPGLEKSKFIDVSAGGFQSFALTDTGMAFAWGGNYTGQLGLGHVKTDYLKSPLIIQNEFIEKIACGENHTLLLCKSGNLYSCGYNSNSQCGLNTLEKINNLPVKVAEEVVDCSAGHQFSVILKKDSILYGIGFNVERAVSSQNLDKISEFREIEGQNEIPKSLKIQMFKCGGNFTIVNYK